MNALGAPSEFELASQNLTSTNLFPSLSSKHPSLHLSRKETTDVQR